MLYLHILCSAALGVFAASEVISSVTIQLLCSTIGILKICKFNQLFKARIVVEMKKFWLRIFIADCNCCRATCSF